MTWWLVAVAVSLVAAAVALVVLARVGAELGATAIALDGLGHDLRSVPAPLHDDARALAEHVDTLRPEPGEARG